MTTRLTDVDDLDGDDRKFFDVDGEEIVLFVVDGDYYALRNFCPHMEGPLGRGRIRTDQDGCTVRCPCHGWEFDAESGEATFNDKHTVKTYDVFVEDGGIYVE
ncbi:ferredoxin [Halobacteriales archaeon QS_1_68_20]|nr:MAG: ferredoxin [Halobacteriales archaeon QS_1_68_20]